MTWKRIWRASGGIVTSEMHSGRFGSRATGVTSNSGRGDGVDAISSRSRSSDGKKSAVATSSNTAAGSTIHLDIEPPRRHAEPAQAEDGARHQQRGARRE